MGAAAAAQGGQGWVGRAASHPPHASHPATPLCPARSFLQMRVVWDAVQSLAAVVQESRVALAPLRKQVTATAALAPCHGCHSAEPRDARTVAHIGKQSYKLLGRPRCASRAMTHGRRMTENAGLPASAARTCRGPCTPACVEHNFVTHVRTVFVPRRSTPRCTRRLASFTRWLPRRAARGGWAWRRRRPWRVWSTPTCSASSRPRR